MTRHERLENIIKQARERAKKAMRENDKLNFDFYTTIIRKSRFLQKNPYATIDQWYKA